MCELLVLVCDQVLFVHGMGRVGVCNNVFLYYALHGSVVSSCMKWQTCPCAPHFPAREELTHLLRGVGTGASGTRASGAGGGGEGRQQRSWHYALHRSSTWIDIHLSTLCTLTHSVIHELTHALLRFSWFIYMKWHTVRFATLRTLRSTWVDTFEFASSQPTVVLPSIRTCTAKEQRDKNLLQLMATEVKQMSKSSTKTNF